MPKYSPDLKKKQNAILQALLLHVMEQLNRGEAFSSDLFRRMLGEEEFVFDPGCIVQTLSKV
jgi:hypothetical protein